MVLTAIGCALSVGLLLAIDFGLIRYETIAQAEHAKRIIVIGVEIGALWGAILMLYSMGTTCRIWRVLLGKTSVLGAYILGTNQNRREPDGRRDEDITRP